ncbi:MAG: hypothetical protein JW713_16915 [Pontiellaceae bacterium]|nr:hypothetical protein [Pontiellaceae bacterium]
MNTRIMKQVAFGGMAALLSLGMTSRAALVEWGGVDGEYTDGANWVGGSLPDMASGTDSALISGGNITYTPGGDLAIHGGSTLQVSGGSWTQVGSVAWIQMAGGNLLVDGGVFNQGTSGNIVRDASSSISVTGGVANFSGNFLYEAAQGSLTLGGNGVMNVANEFKPIDLFAMSGGTLTANLISFADGAGYITLSGGRIEVNGAGGFSGFYGGGGGKSIDFTPDSSGELFFASYTLEDLAADGFLNNGTITLNGGVDASAFDVSEMDGGVLVAIPEPTVISLIGGPVLHCCWCGAWPWVN